VKYSVCLRNVPNGLKNIIEHLWFGEPFLKARKWDLKIPPVSKYILQFSARCLSYDVWHDACFHLRQGCLFKLAFFNCLPEIKWFGHFCMLRLWRKQNILRLVLEKCEQTLQYLKNFSFGSIYFNKNFCKHLTFFSLEDLAFNIFLNLATLNLDPAFRSIFNWLSKVFRF